MGYVAAFVTSPALAKAKKRRRAHAKPKSPKSLMLPTIGPFDDLANKILHHLRETACYAGTPDALDGGPLARSLNDYSPDAEATLRAEFQSGCDLMARVRLKTNSPLPAQLATINAILENGTRSAAIAYGHINPFNFSGHVPYLVNQISGPHIDSVNIMMEQQSLSTANAVDAWLEKLDSFPRAFDGVIEKLRADQAAGCRPPKILLEKSLPIFDAFTADKVADHPMVRALNQRMINAGLSKRITALAIKRASTLLQRRVQPSYAKLRTHIAGMVAEGRDEAGLWTQPDGDALYLANVSALGDTKLSPNEINKIGLDETARISAEMNRLLAKQGMTQGSIGDRMASLANRPANQFANSDAGRAALLDYVRGKALYAEQHYVKLLPAAMIPHHKFNVKPVQIGTQNSAPGGYYDPPSVDGARPGTYWINLRDMEAIPRFRLPTLTFHEGVPGHHTQAAIAAGLSDVPLFIKIASFNAYQEGWALYAEQLMAEIGAYSDDSLGNLGRLQDELFRAARLVIDTGLHHKRWSREQAIETMFGITGAAMSRVTAEVERYMAWPGQALGYKLGHLRLLAMREAFRAKAGSKADLRPFHAAILGGGAMPLDILQQRLRQNT